MKCSKCMYEKMQNSFHKNTVWCKDCQREYGKIWTENNKSRLNAKRRKKYNENVEENRLKAKVKRAESELKFPGKVNNRKAELKRQKTVAMTDTYVKRVLGLKHAPIELIEAKRISLKIKRFLKAKK